MLAVGGTDNDVRKPEIMVMTSLQAESHLLITPITSQTCHAKPKTQINRRRTLPASFPLVGWPTASSLAWKTSLRKVRTLWHCSRLRSVGAFYLWLIVVISVRQSTVAAISGPHCRAGYGRLEHKADSPIAKFKEAGGTVREIDVWAESLPGIISRSLSASSPARHGLLIITVITPLPTKPSATKMPENWSWRTRQLLEHVQMRQRDVAALDAKYTKSSWC